MSVVYQRGEKERRRKRAGSMEVVAGAPGSPGGGSCPLWLFAVVLPCQQVLG